MSDMNNPNSPNNPNNFDKYGNTARPTARDAYVPTATTARAPYILMGLLALVAIVGAAMYFNGGRRTASDVATVPPSITDTRPAPTAPMTGPASTTPAPTATPAAPIRQ